jgi:hypothetical protein
MNSNKPTLAEIKTSINTIKTIIRNIQLKGINTPADKENYFWDNHPDMMNRFAFLISQLCVDIDSPMLNIMLAQLEQIDKGQSLDEADKQIGQTLADTYLPNKKL